MKNIILPLLIASPIFSALLPTANAAAIALDPSTLRPRLLSPASFKKGVNGAVPTGAIKLPRLLNSSNEITPAVSSSLNLSTGLSVSGAGTLTLTGSNTYTGGSLVTHVGLGDFNASQTLDSLTIDGGAFVTLSNPIMSNPPSVVVGGNVTGGVLQIRPVNGGSITNNSLTGGSIRANASSGTITLGAPAAPSPVPEPGSAMLVAIGALAASQTRRRRVS